MINGRILVVDDDEGMRVTLKKILANRGYYVTTAADFYEANYYLQQEEFDTVVADIILSDINGLELLRIIKEKSPYTPTIMITGEPNLESAIESIRLGAYDYLIKPITKNNLPSIVAKAVEKKRLLQEKSSLQKENLLCRQNLMELLEASYVGVIGTISSSIKKEFEHQSIKQLNHKEANQTKNDVRRTINHLLSLENYKRFNPRRSDLDLLLKKTLSLIPIPQNIIIKTDLDTLPQVMVDEAQIQQVFINLIQNAILAMANQTGELIITAKKIDNMAEINFMDTGVGISKSNQERLFEPFFTTWDSRMGLGLPVCKFLLEKHGGTILCQSKEGQGSIFTIQLPLKT